MRLSRADRHYLRKLLDQYLVREFGEEMARVCKLPYEQRLDYIADMMDHARACGVSFEKPADGVVR
jgi:hypothetical protein